MPSLLKLSNNAVGRLASNRSAADTTLILIAGDGARFPALTGDEFFPATLIRGSDGAIEIVKVTARSTDSLTVQRAQEGTAALAFLGGDRVELRLTAGTFATEVARVEGKADAVDAAAVKLTGDQTIAGIKTFSSNPISSATQSTAAGALTRRDFVLGLDGANVKLTGNQTIGGIKTFTEDLTVRDNVIQQGAIEIGRDGSGDRNAFVDFHSHGAPNANDFSARILRNPGADGTLLIQNTGGGQIAFSGATYAFSGVAMPAPEGSAPLYMCRAWVNFNGTTTPPTIRASGNVSSVTRNGTGDYTVNFTTAMPDANYSVTLTRSNNNDSGSSSVAAFVLDTGSSVTASSFRIITDNTATGANQDSLAVHVAIFR
jgi:hypothetical protein